MENALLVAQILGPIYLLVGLSLAFNNDHYMKVYKDWMKSDALMYMGGLMALAVGIAIIRVYNVWESNWSVLVTIVGWLALLKGVMLTLFPMQMKAHVKAWMEGNMMQLAVVVSLVIGVVFTYYGYLQ